MFSNPTVVQQGSNYHVSHGSDKGLFVEFLIESVKDDEKSLSEGRPIYRDIELIEIRIVGDNKTVVRRPVDLVGSGNAPADNIRFPHQYQAFKNKQVQQNVGTPLEQWPILTKSEVMELKGVNIHTVEMLADCPDGNLKWMGAREMQKKAKLWLENAKNGAGLGQLQAENDLLKAEIESLKKQMAEIAKKKAKEE